MNEIELLRFEVGRLQRQYDELLALINRRPKGGGVTGGTIDNPKIIGLPLTEGSENPRTEVWDRTVDLRAVTAHVTSRVVYNHAGSKILYEMRRPYLFDSAGMLYSIGEEQRITIDQVVQCVAV